VKHRTSTRLLLVVAAAALLLVPIVAIAADGFTDVEGDNVFRNDIQWLADAEVTLGCNPPTNDQFCPKANVTREQMAAFLHRLAENQVVDAATALEADHAATALEADHAATADDAGTLGGFQASDFALAADAYRGPTAIMERMQSGDAATIATTDSMTVSVECDPSGATSHQATLYVETADGYYSFDAEQPAGRIAESNWDGDVPVSYRNIDRFFWSAAADEIVYLYFSFVDFDLPLGDCVLVGKAESVFDYPNP